MLKKILFAMLLILPLGVFAQSLKFGHVKSNEIIVVLPETKKAQEELKAMEKKYMDEIKRTTEEFQKKYAEFQQATAKNALPKNIAERRQKELEDMAQRSQQFQQEAQQAMQKAQNDLMAPIYQKVEKAIQTVGKEKGMVYIFDLARTSIPYVNTAVSVDVTTAVKAKLGVK